MSVIIGAVVVGAILGVIGQLLLKGRQNIPWWATIGAGIVAAFIGGAIANWLGVSDTDGPDWIQYVIQIIVAVIAIWSVTALIGDSNKSGSVGRDVK